MSNMNHLPPAAALSRRDSQMDRPQQNNDGAWLARLPLKRGERVLHLNCGSGAGTCAAARAVAGGSGMAAGLDPSAENIAQARAAAHGLDNVLFAIGDADEIPWRDEYFNRAFCLQAFERYRNPSAILREISRVLVPGGSLHLVVPLAAEDASATGVKGGSHLPCEEDYKRMLEEEGFEHSAMTHIADEGPPAGHCEGTLMIVAQKPIAEEKLE